MGTTNRTGTSASPLTPKKIRTRKRNPENITWNPIHRKEKITGVKIRHHVFHLLAF
jgi:hypothetical protein